MFAAVGTQTCQVHQCLCSQEGMPDGPSDAEFCAERGFSFVLGTGQAVHQADGVLAFAHRMLVPPLLEIRDRLLER